MLVHGVLRGFSMGEGNHLKDRFVDIQHILARRDFSDEAVDAADHITIADLSLTPLSMDCFASSTSGGFLVKPAQRGISIHFDCRKRLPDFMGDGGRELSHGSTRLACASCVSVSR